MDCNKTTALELVKNYNRKYNTNFNPTTPYRLFPDENGVYEFKDQAWPCNGRAGVYLILSRDYDVIYVGQTISFGRRFYGYFKDVNGHCNIRSDNWSEKPYAIIAIAAPDDRKYERLSLEEYLINNLQPNDNVRGR
ncbi:MAG: GIY-YIG nuclease family protein [Muribaculaceae bacterium]|nr:GIY-YIG nuclease family protein [Muribaculaceae bacterium]